MSPSFREQQQKLREQLIIQASLELIRTRGYVAMTMDDVAARVGISKATLYQHFRSKEELAATTAGGVVKQMADHLAGIDPTLPAIERLERLIRHLVAFRYGVERSQETRSVGGLTSTLLPIVWDHPRFREQYDRLIAALCALIDQGKAEGEIVRHVPSRVLVQAMLGLIRDFNYAELLDAAPISPEELSEALSMVFLRGIRSRGDDARLPEPTDTEC